MDEYVRNIGTEKKMDFDKDIDNYLDFYVKKARSLGYVGKLKFKIEKGKVIIFAVI